MTDAEAGGTHSIHPSFLLPSSLPSTKSPRAFPLYQVPGKQTGKLSALGGLCLAGGSSELVSSWDCDMKRQSQGQRPHCWGLRGPSRGPKDGRS